MPTDIDLHIKELRHSASVASLNCDIWLVYKSKDTRSQYLETMNRYSLFFQTSIHAHFVAMLIALYRLYETRRDTFNIPSLLRAFKKEHALDDHILRELDQIYQRAKPLWVKVNILRNKAFGHRCVAHRVDGVFKEAGVTYNELRELVEITKELLNKLSHTWDKSVHAFNLDAREDTIRLLENLKT